MNFNNCNNRKATVPYDSNAIAEADRVAPHCRDAEERRRWMDTYIAAGGKWECADPVGKTPRSVTEDCPPGDLVVGVFNRSNGRPIADAKVTLQNVGTRRTDATGGVSWFKLSGGMYVVMADKEGYAPAIKPDVRVHPSATTSVTLQLVCQVTHVLILFEGWNAPWEEEGGKSVADDVKSTINAIKHEALAMFAAEQSINDELDGHTLAAVAYATDTDDDVKDLAISFIKNNRKNNGKVIIYGYSWGGDTAVEIAKDLKEQKIDVDLLVTIDPALGPFNGWLVRDRKIPDNVKINKNHYTLTPDSRVGSQGLPNWAADPSKTTVENIVHGKKEHTTHAKMDEKTAEAALGYIADELAREGRYCE